MLRDYSDHDICSPIFFLRFGISRPKVPTTSWSVGADGTPRPEFESHVRRISGPWGKKSPPAVLAARHGPCGYGPGFGGFLGWMRSRSRFLLIKYGWGPFYPPGRVLAFQGDEMECIFSLVSS